MMRKTRGALSFDPLRQEVSLHIGYARVSTDDQHLALDGSASVLLNAMALPGEEAPILSS